MNQSFNNSDNSTDDIVSKNKIKIRRNKKELFSIERKLFISKLNDIIQLEKNNNSVIYDDLVENIELKQYLIDNVELIKKYYSCSNWGYFTTHLHGNIPKNEVTLMKSIFKNEGFNITSKSKTIIRHDGIKKICTLLYFIL